MLFKDETNMQNDRHVYKSLNFLKVDSNF